MDEQNARASEDSYPSTELNAESSNFAREYLPEQNQPTHELETAGDRSCFVDVTSPARKWVDGFVDDNAHLKDSTQSVVTQSGLQDDEDAKDSGQLPTCIESLEIGRVDPDQQLCGSASADTDMICVVQEDGVDAGSEDISMPDGRAALTHVDGLEETGGSHSAHFTVDDDRDEGTSLEMLSVAVESFENMQRRSEEGFKNFSNALENLEFRKWQTIEGTAAEMETDSINKLSMTKSTNESEDNESSVIDGSSAPSAEFQDKEHFLNMLCELAAVRQQERERSSISQQLASCMTSLANNDELSDESKRLSFVDLLRKQMVHVGAFTDLSADAIYEELLKQNQEFLGCKVGKDLNLPTPFGSKFSNEGAMASLEIDKKSTGTFHRKSDVPSTDEISHDSESGDIKPLAKSGGASKEETGDDQNLVVGDLVWAKVKSHPWWPGQIFDVADASAAAKRIQKPGRTLVAFFGDGTFNWLWQSQLIPFVPNFADKVKQTTMKSFCRAVADALDEVSRRTELGLKCSHLGDAVYSKNLFPDLNAGIKKGVRLECHKDIEVSKGQLQPERVLKFLRTAACSPLYSLSSGLEYSKLCGHVYGFRSFMLSSKRPERNPTLVNPIKPENSMQRSVLKRRLGQDEPGGGPNFGVGKEMKRRHLSKDAGVKESSAGGRVQSPRLRSIETLLTTEDEESKAAESDLKSHEQAQGSTWLAKGKRLHVSPECKEKKRVRGWQSLGPLRDAKKLGIETTVDNSGSSDDDNRTLFDITGYHSLKTKKKGVRKSTTDVPSKAVGQQLLKVKQELSKKQRSVDLDENRDAEDGLPEIGNSLLLSQPDPCLPPVIEDSKNAEKGKIETREPLDSQNAGDKDTQDCRKAEKGNDDMMDLRDADLEVREQVKEETSDLKVDCMESTKKQETKLLDSKAERENERFEAELKAEVRDSSEKGNETLDVRIAQKSEKEHLKSKSIDQIEKDEVELGVDNPAGKQTKRRNSETGDNLGRLIKLKKKRRQDAQDYPQGSLSSVPESEETIPRKSVKTSKLGLSLRKVAGALKASKGTIGLKSDYPSPKRPALAGGRSGLNKEDFNSSLPKLLNILQLPQLLGSCYPLLPMASFLTTRK
ncbi:hypothetical protein GOP47_0013249 [Adiantum capillus-veneris]|uniref:PWWP domain-containing protein n=1 Tax=Adiantum capillus-veneris TaxID=13818 RepID=A0A9D4UPF2_ADICA|nr:hypothetical protein GOP47_0013249 [Adiantum capillus-veneris]